MFYYITIITFKVPLPKKGKGSTCLSFENFLIQKFIFSILL